jgi:hypothetical protein
MRQNRLWHPRLSRSFLVAFLACSAFLSSLNAEAEGASATLSLHVTIQSRHIDNFEMCFPVQPDKPFRITWGDGDLRSSLSGVIHSLTGDRYAASLEISEVGTCRSKRGITLNLNEPYDWEDLVSSAFNHIDSRRLVLTTAACE